MLLSVANAIVGLCGRCRKWSENNYSTAISIDAAQLMHGIELELSYYGRPCSESVPTRLMIEILLRAKTPSWPENTEHTATMVLSSTV